MGLVDLFFCHNNETEFDFTGTGADLSIILYTRDISHGRGRRDLAYAMIVSLYMEDPDLAMKALRLCASKYGSWCDIKYFCRYVSQHSLIYIDGGLGDKMIDMAVDILVHQLRVDYMMWAGALAEHLDNLRTISRPIGREILSHAAKWVPREKSAMGWLFDCIVERWACSHYNSRYKREFRKIVSELNREIGTVEIKQCAQEFHNIMYEHIPIKALVGQYRSFAGLEVYPKRVGVGVGAGVGVGGRSFEHACRNLVKIALSVNDGRYDDMLNHIWSKNQVNYSSQDIVPVVDISAGGGCYHAIGLGILIAQNSSHGHLVLSEHDAYSIPAGFGDSFTSIIARIRPFLSGVTDSRLDLAINLDRVVILSENGNVSTVHKDGSKVFHWFFGHNSGDCDYTYCDSMYLLSHFANLGTTQDYISMILASDRYQAN